MLMPAGCGRAKWSPRWPPWAIFGRPNRNTKITCSACPMAIPAISPALIGCCPNAAPRNKHKKGRAGGAGAPFLFIKSVCYCRYRGGDDRRRQLLNETVPFGDGLFRHKNHIIGAQLHAGGQHEIGRLARV